MLYGQGLDRLEVRGYSHSCADVGGTEDTGLNIQRSQPWIEHESAMVRIGLWVAVES